jgi:molybdate transport system substrate-binding protein
LTGIERPMQSAVAPGSPGKTGVSVRAYRIVVLVAAFAVAAPLRAEPVRVAVASNFAGSAEALGALYRQRDPAVQIRFSAGSSGKLYAQIENGAPFDLFLSADRERPERLEQRGLAVAGSRFTYAVGRLVLWSAVPALQGKDCRQALLDLQFRHLALANPGTAPYGAAALAVLDRLGLPPRKLGARVVQGENIAQTLQFVATGNAELGFVALSQLTGPGAPVGTCRWVIPADHHPPIAQQAVLLTRARANASATGLFEFLKSDTARALIAAHGYDLD